MNNPSIIIFAALALVLGACSNLTDLTTPEPSSAAAVSAAAYTISYQGNGSTSGTAPTDSAKYKAEALVSLASSGDLVRTGSYFNGWKTAASGGTLYAGGSSLVMGRKNVTLYADWQLRHGVSYSGNGNTGGNAPTDSGSYAKNDAVAVQANVGGLVKTASGAYQNFIGWNTKADGTGTNYAAGTSFKMGTADVPLYAVWSSAPVYMVTYVGNGSVGGTAPLNSALYKTGSVVTVLGNTGNFVKTGKTFLSWNTAADGSGTTYTAGQTFAMGTENVTLYAIWSLSVVYSGNGNLSGLVPTDTAAYVAGQTASVKDNTGILRKTGTGYGFSCWNTALDGTGIDYRPGSTVTLGSGDVTLYAKWSKVLCSIFDDYDSDYSTAPFNDNVTVYDASGVQQYSATDFNVCQVGGGMHKTIPAFEPGCLWVSEYPGVHIKKLDASGNVLVDIPLAIYAIAVRPTDGSLYAVKGSTLNKYSTGGTLLSSQTITNGFDISYSGYDDTFIVCSSSGSVIKVDANLNVVWTNSSALASNFGASVAVNPANGDVWVVGKNTSNMVVRLNSSGVLQNTIAYGAVVPYCVALDPSDGSVFVGSNSSTIHYDASGNTLNTIAHPAWTIAVDAEGYVWLGPMTENCVYRYTPSGTLLFTSPASFSTSDKFLSAYTQ